jgi:hypothetical protein
MTGMNWRERPQNVSFVLLLAHLRSTDEVTPSQPTSSALTVERRTIPTLKIIVPKRRSLLRMERAKVVDDMPRLLLAFLLYDHVQMIHILFCGALIS